VAMLAAVSSAAAVSPDAKTPPLDTWAHVPGVLHLHYAAGPYTVTPGANLILLDTKRLPKPDVDGFMVRFAPNLHYALPNGTCCGGVPRVDVIHLHHGVWLTNGQAGAGEGNGYIGGFYPFIAVGEEKTITDFPSGYGYPVGANDVWFLNYMIHNLTAKAAKVYITYDIDFIPADSPTAAGITPVHPIWMDVRDHNIYPVFNVKRHSGKHGKFTYPDMAKNPYAGDPAPLNMFTVDHPGTLIGTAGHLHPGGLYDELDDIRAGASPSGGAIRGPVPDSVRLFRSYAHYWDKAGPISWDLAMTATPPDWRVAVKPGDQLRISVTYDTTRASWYEAMGIMVVWEAWNDTTGIDPFTHKLDQNGKVTHGHLPENNHHGGAMPLNISLKNYRDCRTKNVAIAGFAYDPGGFNATGKERCIPTIRKGQSLTFTNDDAYNGGPLNIFTPSRLYLVSIFHSVTACQYPCGLNTGISYPIANGAGNYDSGQLGIETPAVGRLSWSTPTSLKPGTYTFFCRIHPFMRGVFRIIG
jgi:hypothetical protein